MVEVDELGELLCDTGYTCRLGWAQALGIPRESHLVPQTVLGKEGMAVVGCWVGLARSAAPGVAAKTKMWSMVVMQAGKLGPEIAPIVCRTGLWLEVFKDQCRVCSE